MEKVKRTRKSTARSKSGCITCKVRKVKCDERRPTCTRCEGFGIRCDGYVLPTRKRLGPAGEGRRELAPKSLEAIAPAKRQRFEPWYDPIPAAQSRWQPLAVGHNVSVPIPLNIFQFDSEAEERYFALFQDKTSIQIAPYFDSETWRRLVLQSCHVPYIRHAVIAIAALHRTSMTVGSYKKMFLDGSVNNANPTVHHQMAIDQYAKAISSMRRAVSSGSQDLRTTLISCLVIACFEAFHGNIPLAHGQIRSGIELLNNWKSGYGEKFLISYASPNQHVIEDDLVNTFGRLEIATGYAYTDDDEIHEIRRKQTSKTLREMPPRFDNLTHARVYLELIFRQLEHYIYVSATWPDTYHKHTMVEERTAQRLRQTRISVRGWPDAANPKELENSDLNVWNEPEAVFPYEKMSWNSRAKDRKWGRADRRTRDESLRSDEGPAADFPESVDLLGVEAEADGAPEPHDAPLGGITSLNQDTNWKHIDWEKAERIRAGTSKTDDEPPAEFPEFVKLRDVDGQADDAFESHEVHLSELLQWNYSFEAMMKQQPNPREDISSLMLRMHFKICYICLKTCQDDLMLPDIYNTEFQEIVSLSRRMLEALQAGETTNFTLDFGINIPLYITGFKCRISSVRREVVDLLLNQPRREGFWDSQMAGKIVRWIQELEEEYVARDFIPEWARIRPSEVGFNMMTEAGTKATNDTLGREAEMVYHQRISPDNFETRERRITVNW